MVEEGFDVTESYQLPSLKSVKEDRVVMPATRGALMRINKATTRLVRMTEKGNANSGSVRALNIDVSLPEGIEVPSENGEVTTKYVNKRIDFGIDLEFQVVKPEVRQEEKYTGKNQSFLVPLKQLLAALGYDLDNPPAINDSFLAELAGKTFRVDILRRPDRAFDDSTGKWISLAEKRDDEGNVIDPGSYHNEYRNYQPA